MQAMFEGQKNHLAMGVMDSAMELSEMGAQETTLLTFQQSPPMGIADITVDAFGTTYQQQDNITIAGTSMWFPIYSFTGTRQYEGKVTISYQQVNNTLALMLKKLFATLRRKEPKNCLFYPHIAGKANASVTLIFPTRQ